MKALFVALLVLGSLGLSAQVAHLPTATGCSVTGTNSTSSGSMTFSCTPNTTNHAVLFKVGCGNDSGPVTNVTLTATGWTITPMSTVIGSGSSGWIASFAAIAPNTSATTFTATFTGATTCGSYHDWGVDEFSGNDITGGTTTFDAHNQASGSGSCSVSITPVNNNDAVWGACEDSTTAVGTTPILYTVGENDGGGDWTEFAILTGGSGVSQTVNFSGSGAFNVVAVTIKPALVVTPPNAGFTGKVALIGRTGIK